MKQNIQKKNETWDNKNDTQNRRKQTKIFENSIGPVSYHWLHGDHLEILLALLNSLNKEMFIKKKTGGNK